VVVVGEKGSECHDQRDEKNELANAVSFSSYHFSLLQQSKAKVSLYRNNQVKQQKHETQQQASLHMFSDGKNPTKKNIAILDGGIMKSAIRFQNTEGMSISTDDSLIASTMEVRGESSKRTKTGMSVRSLPRRRTI
jgi:hypothetical protein